MREYATLAEAQAWAETEDFPARLVRSANLVVGTALRLDVYATDTAGLPTDATLRAATRDAVCAQVALWVQLGSDPSAGRAGDQGTVSASSIGGGSVQYSTSAAQAEDRADAVTTLAPEAVRLLTDVGLLSGRVLT